MQQNTDSETQENLARKLFNGIKIKTTSTDASHMGVTVGSEKFKQKYVKMKVKEITEELEKLSKTGHRTSEPHAAYPALTHGWKHKWTYLSRTIPGIGVVMRSVENCIRYSCIPATTNGNIK